VYDVTVIGAGPAGSYVAGSLAAAGHRVLVVEKRDKVGKASCAGIVGQECIQAFNIPENIILRRLNSATLFSPSGKPLHITRPEPQAAVLDRAAFDTLLAERAQAAGADYRFQCRAVNVITERDKTTTTVIYKDKEETIASQALVLAAGFAPGLLGRLGLGAFRDFTIGAQAEVTAPGLSEVEIYFGAVAPGFFAWLAPTSPPLARAGLLARQRPGRYLQKWLAELAVAGKIASTEVRISYGGIPLRPLRRTSGERLIVVGDAAGQVKPTSGGGIYYGHLAAASAADVLHDALSDGDLSAKRLARYERAWRKQLGREIRIGYWARRLYERLDDRQVDRLFATISARGIDTALLRAPDLSFDWHAKTILRLLRYQAVAGMLHIVKLPFSAGRIDPPTAKRLE
jgi:digeranylgeranylglycerophospholipid reductase